MKAKFRANPQVQISKQTYVIVDRAVNAGFVDEYTLSALSDENFRR